MGAGGWAPRSPLPLTLTTGMDCIWNRQLRVLTTADLMCRQTERRQPRPSLSYVYRDTRIVYSLFSAPLHKCLTFEIVQTKKHRRQPGVNLRSDRAGEIRDARTDNRRRFKIGAEIEWTHDERRGGRSATKVEDQRSDSQAVAGRGHLPIAFGQDKVDKQREKKITHLVEVKIEAQYDGIGAIFCPFICCKLTLIVVSFCRASL